MNFLYKNSLKNAKVAAEEVLPKWKMCVFPDPWQQALERFDCRSLLMMAVDTFELAGTVELPTAIDDCRNDFFGEFLTHLGPKMLRCNIYKP